MFLQLVLSGTPKVAYNTISWRFLAIIDSRLAAGAQKVSEQTNWTFQRNSTRCSETLEFLSACRSRFLDFRSFWISSRAPMSATDCRWASGASNRPIIHRFHCDRFLRCVINSKNSILNLQSLQMRNSHYERSADGARWLRSNSSVLPVEKFFYFADSLTNTCPIKTWNPLES